MVPRILLSSAAIAALITVGTLYFVDGSGTSPTISKSAGIVQVIPATCDEYRADPDFQAELRGDATTDQLELSLGIITMYMPYNTWGRDIRMVANVGKVPSLKMAFYVPKDLEFDRITIRLRNLEPGGIPPKLEFPGEGEPGEATVPRAYFVSGVVYGSVRVSSPMVAEIEFEIDGVSQGKAVLAMCRTAPNGLSGHVGF